MHGATIKIIHLNVILSSTPGTSKWLWTFDNKILFYGDELLALRPTPTLNDHPLSAVRDCLFNIFAATFHVGGRSSTRNRRMQHAVVAGTHLSRVIYIW